MIRVTKIGTLKHARLFEQPPWTFSYLRQGFNCCTRCSIRIAFQILSEYLHKHRRIQDFVRGGPRPSWPPGGGAKALLARASLFGGAIFCGEGGAKAPLAPPLDPRMISNSISPFKIKSCISSNRGIFVVIENQTQHEILVHMNRRQNFPMTNGISRRFSFELK